ncbi:MAG: glycosyl hydrolase family 95 catalytic domain-containing protein [Lachnospira eligens]
MLRFISWNGKYTININTEMNYWAPTLDLMCANSRL